MADFSGLLTASDVAAKLPSRRAGRPTNARTVRGWMAYGLRGVKLRYVPVAGVRMTRMEWVEDFFRAVDVADEEPDPKQLATAARLKAMGAL